MNTLGKEVEEAMFHLARPWSKYHGLTMKEPLDTEEATALRLAIERRIEQAARMAAEYVLGGKNMSIMARQSIAAAVRHAMEAK